MICLEKNAWDRVMSSDADLNKRLVELKTSDGMQIKIKLIICLETDPGLKF